MKKELADIKISEDVQPTEEDVIITEVKRKQKLLSTSLRKCPELRILYWYKLLKTKSTAKRLSVAGPIVKVLQDPAKFYCDKFPCFYTRPDELARHMKKNCSNEDADYFCDACHRGFFYKNTLREHYYHEHTDIILWHCKKCNEGFLCKSNRSKHRHACPNKNGPHQYPQCEPYDEVLEETFKPKTAIAVKIPTEVQVDDEPQEEGENVGQPQPQPQVSDQVQLQVRETEKAVSSLGETGSDILNRLAEGEIFGGVIDDEDDQSKVVMKGKMEIKMTFDN